MNMIIWQDIKKSTDIYKMQIFWQIFSYDSRSQLVNFPKFAKVKGEPIPKKE